MTTRILETPLYMPGAIAVRIVEGFRVADCYKKFLEIMEAVEDSRDQVGFIEAYFDDGSFRITPNDLKRIAEQYRALEKERDAAQGNLEALKSRSYSLLEDF